MVNCSFKATWSLWVQSNCSGEHDSIGTGLRQRARHSGRVAKRGPKQTTLVIAHRLSTVVDAHEILVMEAGRILERGTHAQLLALSGRYAQLWALQQSAE